MAVHKRSFTVRLELEPYAKFKRIVRKSRRSMSDYVAYLIDLENERFEEEYGPIVLSDDEIYY